MPKNFATQLLVFFACGSIVLAAGKPAEPKARYLRSPDEPDNGRLELKYDGHEGSLKYNHHLLRSDDGNFALDAYAEGKRNYDRNQNDFQGGLQGHWYFPG
ncbi:uncharacterized protein LOC105665391 [Ceratitis capitata]|uniref:(Mediterranean fruit fly) hypothetical protein n=1 Tax=Ceratitis capitata TaxID=7213 RepID=W8CA45_CERCA|nr:uncharacterized protein LOC105665391 [Ceratitis capitata]CAD7003096.1 unnamed protein product [Ceratitis capitata]